jgi:hypothetical protein
VKLTPEQLSQRRKDQAAEKLARKERFPGASLERIRDPWAVVLELTDGDGVWLDVKKRGTWCKEAHGSIWESVSIPLTDLHDLALFIRALTARYNRLAEVVNRDTEGCHLVKITEIEEPKPE